MYRDQSKPEALTNGSSNREKALFRCRMAENAERFDDMVKFIKEACKETNEEALGPSERNYLSVAYKNSVGTRRNALRCLIAMKHKYEQKNSSVNVEIIDEYYKEVLKEMKDICYEVLSLIKDTIFNAKVFANLKGDLPSCEFKVFFYKMLADYYRYLAEFATDSEKDEAVKNASDNYKKATEEATAEGTTQLPSSHPIRLGLCLNYSVFLYEIEDKPEEAKKLAKQAFDEALDNLDATGELEYKDSTLILQLLRDNSTLWCSQDTDNPPAPAAPAAAPAPAE